MGTITQPFSLTATSGSSTGPVVSSAALTADFGAPTGNTLFSTLFGTSMASDVDFTPWATTAIQAAAFNTAGFGLPGMFCRINTNDTSMDGAGNANLTFVDRVTASLPKIMNIPAGQFSYNLGGPGLTNSTQFANGAAAICNRFIANGVPCMQYEVFNENNGLNINTYASILNATAVRLHAIDPAIKIIGTNDSFMDGTRMSSLKALCGSNVARYHYHSYSVDPSFNDAAALAQGISRFSGDASGLRSAIGAGPPAGLGEYNMDGDPPGDARQTTYYGAVWNLICLYTAFTTDPNNTHGALWDWMGDGLYGQIIDPGNNPAGLPPFSVIPLGYALNFCRQKLCYGSSGATASITANSNSGNLAVIATSKSADCALLLINYSTGSAVNNISIAFSRWPVNGSGTRVMNTYQISPSNGTTLVGTLNVTNGLSAGITLPAMSVTVVSTV